MSCAKSSQTIAALEFQLLQRIHHVGICHITGFAATWPIPRCRP
ncbi:hypothetical protein SVIOM342S_01674 [Streptomyces violaceorubidus]